MILRLKKLFRQLYYYFSDGKTVPLEGYQHLTGLKWIISKSYGRAYFKGYYEPKICNYLLKNLNEDAVFLDIGAHAGYFSIFSANLAKQGLIYCFEPNPQNSKFIKSIINLNQITNINLVEKAVGDVVGKVHFEEGGTTSTGKISEKGIIEVPITMLDVELMELQKVDLIKIDVEGFGGKVLEGGLNIINKFKPKIMMEIHRHSDELEKVVHHLSPIYNLTELNTGKEVNLSREQVHFIIADPK